jgi:hypothetical protein
MDKIASDLTATTAASEGAKVFRVECAGLSGWVVSLVGQQKTSRFLNQDLAVRHAQQRAHESRPSVVVVIEADGTVVRGWEFPCEGGTDA